MVTRLWCAPRLPYPDANRLRLSVEFKEPLGHDGTRGPGAPLKSLDERVTGHDVHSLEEFGAEAPSSLLAVQADLKASLTYPSVFDVSTEGCPGYAPRSS